MLTPIYTWFLRPPPACRSVQLFLYSSHPCDQHTQTTLRVTSVESMCAYYVIVLFQKKVVEGNQEDSQLSHTRQLSLLLSPGQK